jgi:hypothetical protein
MKIIVFVMMVVLLMATVSDARTYKISYTEPTTNSDGTALTDLAKCSMYYQIPAGTATKAWDQTATSATGGGTITDKDTIVTVPIAQEELVDFWGTCTDTGNNESAATIKVRLKISPTFPMGIIVR